MKIDKFYMEAVKEKEKVKWSKYNDGLFDEGKVNMKHKFNE